MSDALLGKKLNYFRFVTFLLEPLTGKGWNASQNSDTEVGATFFVRSPSLLWGMSGTSAGILFQTHLFPFSVADFVLSVPFLK